jgi:hypothetical protein
MEREGGRTTQAVPEPEPAVAQPQPAPTVDSAARVLALQRSAGNAAVAAWLGQRTQRAMLQRNGDALNVLPDPIEVNWASDTFTLSFERTEEDGGRFEFVLTYTGPHPFDGPGVRDKVARLSVMIGPKALKARVTRNDATTVAVDLYGDGSKVVKLVDKPSIDTRPFSKGREHDLSAVDLGRSVYARSVWVRDPKASAADIPVIVPEESPGANPESKLTSEGSEIILDGDGDQNKELKVVLKATSNHEGSEAAKTVSVKVTQRSTGQQRDFTFELPKPDFQGRLWPFVKEVTDGKAPTRINLIAPLDKQYLEIVPPGASDNTYVFKAVGTETKVTFPAEAAGRRQTVAAGDTRVIGNIVAVELSLGAYGDKFRLTVENLDDKKAVLSLATVYEGKTKGGFGAELQINGGLRFALIATGPQSAGLDLDGDGKPDVTIFDRLTTPTAMTEPGGSGPPEANRDHQIRVAGPAVSGGEKTFFFKVRDGLLYPGVSDRALDHTAESAQTAVDLLSSQKQEGATFEEQLDAYEMAMMPRRRKAADDKVIPMALYDAWYGLSLAMIKARPQVKQGVPSQLQTEAAKQGAELVAQLRAQDKSWMQGVLLDAYGSRLVPAINVPNWDLAFNLYQRLVSLLDDVMVDRLKEVKGEHSAEAEAATLIHGRRAALVEMSEHKPIRIAATFHPDEKFKTESGYVSAIPLTLYAFRQGDDWHLHDISNPEKPWKYDVEAKDGETTPPFRLLAELDDADHFPEGWIHYDIPGDRGGRVQTTGGMTWKKALTYIGLAAGAVALGLALGPQSLAVYASWAFAASAAATAAAAGIDLAQKSHHGQLDATTVIIDVGLILSALAGVAALRAGYVVKGAQAAATAGTPLAGEAAKWAVFYGKVYLPLRIGAAGADLLVMTASAAKQVDEIEAGHGTDAEKARAKLLALAQLGALAGLQVLQIKGEIGLSKGRNLELYFPKDGAQPLAIPVGKQSPAEIRFSQKDVKGTTGDETMTLEELTEAMKKGGWKGDPIDVVEFPDERGLVSVNNRRLLAARNAGLKEIPMRYHSPKEAFNIEPIAIEQGGFVLKKPIRLVGDELVVGGTKGTIVYPKDAVPKTWEEAVLFRTANQGNMTKEGGGKFPLWGRLKEPVVRQPKEPAPAGGGE